MDRFDLITAFPAILTVILAAARLTGAAPIPWKWVLAPLAVYLVMAAFVVRSIFKFRM